MQNFHDIQQNELLSDGRSHLMNNDKSILSCFSGEAFPTGILIGQLCLRTDQWKLYQLRNLLPTWVLIADLAKTLLSEEDARVRYSPLTHKHKKEDITDWGHGHSGDDISKATKTTTGVVKIGTGLNVQEDGTINVTFANNTVYVNPVAAKDGDIKVVGSVVYIFANNAWRQIYPANYIGG